MIISGAIIWWMQFYILYNLSITWCMKQMIWMGLTRCIVCLYSLSLPLSLSSSCMCSSNNISYCLHVIFFTSALLLQVSLCAFWWPSTEIERVHLLSSFQIQENLNLLCQTRDNIRKIMNQYVFSSSFFYHVDFMMAWYCIFLHSFFCACVHKSIHLLFVFFVDFFFIKDASHHFVCLCISIMWLTYK
jgi:hypothetical protein